MPSRLKKYIHDEYTRRYQDAENIFFARYHGLDTGFLRELRKEVREAGHQMNVIKNSVACVVFDELGFKGLAEVVTEDTIAFVGENPVDIAKLIVEAGKKNKKFTMYAGYMDGEVLDEAAAKAVAEMPSLPELLCMIAGGLNSPGQKLASALNSGAQKMVYALKSYEEKQEG